MYVHSFSYLVNKLELRGYTYLQLKKITISTFHNHNEMHTVHLHQLHVYLGYNLYAHPMHSLYTVCVCISAMGYM